MDRKIDGSPALLSAPYLDIVSVWLKRFAVPYATWWKIVANVTDSVASARVSTRFASVETANITVWNVARPAT
jgi:hypothetical protein